MKKILTFIVSILIVCSSLSFTVFAAGSDNTCYIKGDFESIEYDGSTYRPVSSKWLEIGNDVNIGDYYQIEQKYADKEVEDKYLYTDIYTYSSCPHLIMADVETSSV